MERRTALKLIGLAPILPSFSLKGETGYDPRLYEKYLEQIYKYGKPTKEGRRYLDRYIEKRYEEKEKNNRHK